MPEHRLQSGKRGYFGRAYFRPRASPGHAEGMAFVVSRHAQRHDTSQAPMQKKGGDVHWLSPSDAPRSSAAGQREGPRGYTPRWAMSARVAKSVSVAKNAGDWPVKSPLAVRALAAAMAAPCLSVGRMVDKIGMVLLSKMVGS